uniref:Uncharacterized protein n=1 Tax=Vespula pensylvanica TaxID=30213 RepID=A0A834P8U9_VESPE|nr:hypothetical protein H0235_005141 [Vespula pensylvanica]
MSRKRLRAFPSKQKRKQPRTKSKFDKQASRRRLVAGHVAGLPVCYARRILTNDVSQASRSALREQALPTICVSCSMKQPRRGK